MNLLARTRRIRLDGDQNQINNLAMLKLGFCLIVFCFFGCAHKMVAPSVSADRLSSDLFTEVKVPEPVLLRLKVNLGQIEKTKFNSASKTEVFEGDSLTNTIEESIEFLSRSEVTRVISPDQFIEKITTSNKDGQIDLHDFAMPEIGEELYITYSSMAKVLRANNLPPDSLYFVPPVSLPEDKVNVGDTWTMDARWVTDRGVPLTLRLLSILKRFFACGVNDICADIELSAEVSIDSGLSGVNFESLWGGRVFFAVGRGEMLWSLVQSHEAWNSPTNHRDVQSCLESSVVDPPGWNPWKNDQHKCRIPK